MKKLKIILLSCCLCLLLLACSKNCIHRYQSKITIPPNCTEEGTEIMTCTLCKHSYSQSVPVLEHEFEILEIEKDATCTEMGSQKVRCKVCGEEKSESIKRVAHILENGVTIKEATCSKEGRQKGDCIVCGEKQVIEKIPVNGKHTFSEKITRAATCKEVGEGIRTCTSCKYSEQCQYELRPHSYTKEKILKKATCDQVGSKQFTCSQCEGTFVETIDALGHIWSGATCTVKGVCQVCNKTGTTDAHQYKTISETNYNDLFAGKRVEECEGCGKKMTTYITRQGEIDLESVKEAVASHATKLGFKVSFKALDGTEAETERKIDAFTLNLTSPSNDPQFAQNKIIEMGIAGVDDRYKSYVSSPAGISRYTLYIDSYYNTSAALGQGWFGFRFDVR